MSTHASPVALAAAGSLLEEVACPICAERRYTVLRPARYPEQLSREALVEVFRSSSDAVLMDQLVECAGCGLVYLNPRFSAQVILDSYEGGSDERFAAQNPLRIRTFRRVFARWAERQGLAPGPETRVLDVGCAAGAFPKAVSELGYPVVGVEPSVFLSRFARERYGLDVRSGVLEAQRFADASFRVVTLWDVIEHLADPGATLREIHRVLAPDGQLIVNYPDYASWPRRLMGARWPFFLSVHLAYYTRGTIERLLAQHGFAVRAFGRHYQTLELGYVFERAGQYVPGFGALARAAGAIGAARWPLTYYLGQTLVTAARA